MYCAYIIYCNLMNSLRDTKHRTSYATSTVQLFWEFNCYKMYSGTAQLSQEGR